MKTCKTAVIGIGNMGYAHADCIAAGEIEGLNLTAVCDIDNEKLEYFKGLHQSVNTYSDYSCLLNSEDLDCIIIATPHPFHAQMAEEALEKGIHVLVEKPVDISVSRALRLNEIANKSNKKFAIMFNQRTNPLFIKARELVKSGMLGELKRTNWTITNWYRTQAYYDSGHWRATWAGEGGGVLLNQAPHNLDIWQWICGMPTSVTAFCDIAKYHNIEVEDDVTIFTRYKNNATGTFITSTGEFPGTNRLEIVGDKGKIVIENGTLKWWDLKTSVKDTIFSATEDCQSIDFNYTEYKQEKAEEGHKGILLNFARAISFDEELIAKGNEGINELTISNAAYLSSFKGNCQIQLPFDCEEFDRLLKKRIDKSQYRQKGSFAPKKSGYKKRWQVNW